MQMSAGIKVILVMDPLFTSTKVDVVSSIYYILLGMNMIFISYYLEWSSSMGRFRYLFQVHLP